MPAAMRAQLLHLSGPRRGRTDTPAGAEIVIGTAPDAEVHFPPGAGVATRHATISFDDCGCDFVLRAVDGDVFVEHRQVRELILKNGDLVEFGAGGPKARFRVYPGDAAACKPVRQMLVDAAEVARESGVAASGQTLVRDLLTQATATLKIGFPLVVLGALGVAFAAGWIGRGRVAGSSFAERLDAMRQEIAEVRERQQTTITREEVDALRVEIAARAADIERLAAARSTVRRILEHHSRAVCLIHGAWGIELPPDRRAEQGRWVRGPGGDRIELEYTGSGFHVGDGRIVTNRHVVLPWEVADQFAEMFRAGFEPSMLRLTVTFPGGQPIAADLAATLVRQADRVDVAVLSAPVPAEVPVLEFDLRPAAELAGETVLVVGYPTGVNALLAKADEEAAREIVDAAKGDLGAIVRGLAARNAISPIVTRGVLSEARGSKLVYDAETTVGGSGGPVFGGSGRVVGVNFAILTGFGGSNFGVPAQFALELLD